MSDRNKNGFEPGQLLSAADLVELDKQRREAARKPAPKANTRKAEQE